jgi:hypothetical protein
MLYSATAMATDTTTSLPMSEIPPVPDEAVVDRQVLLMMLGDLEQAAPGSRFLLTDDVGKVTGGLREPSTYPAWMGELVSRRTRQNAGRLATLIKAMLDGVIPSKDIALARDIGRFAVRHREQFYGRWGLTPREEIALDPEHLADLRRSGLSDETIQRQGIRSLWQGAVQDRLGFSPPGVRSGMLIPFADPVGGFMDHTRVKVFPPVKDWRGNSIKYLQPKGSGVRLFFPLATIEEVVRGMVPLWLVEGEKEALAVAQLGLPAVGFCGIEGWHIRGSQMLIPDFDHLRLPGRIVELVPDENWRINPHAERGAFHFAVALEGRGARVKLRVLPMEIAA